MKRYLLLISLLFVSVITTAQDVRELLREVNARFMSVRDYRADALIRADIPFVRMMPVRATVFFKQPDRFKVESKGIALLPRQGFDQMFRNLRDTNGYFPVPQGEEMVRGSLSKIINILPLSDTADLVLGKLWIDPSRKLVIRSQMTTRSNGTVTADYFFGKHASMALPDSMTFTIDTRKFKIPKAVAADLNDTGKKDAKKSPERSKGTIRIAFSDYVINKGVADEKFRK
ncbi:MAG: LolA family protein [Bacteroidota bacterium]